MVDPESTTVSAGKKCCPLNIRAQPPKDCQSPKNNRRNLKLPELTTDTRPSLLIGGKATSAPKTPLIPDLLNDTEKGKDWGRRVKGLGKDETSPLREGRGGCGSFLGLIGPSRANRIMRWAEKGGLLGEEGAPLIIAPLTTPPLPSPLHQSATSKGLRRSWRPLPATNCPFALLATLQR